MRDIEVGPRYPINLEQLPPGWEVARVGDAIPEIQPGFASGVHNQEGIGVPHLRPMNIDRAGRIDLSVLKFVAPDNPLRLQKGDVLFNNTNSAELIGKTAAIEHESDWAFSNHMTRLRPPDGISPGFAALQLHFLWMVGYFLSRCTHHVNQASVSSSTLAESVPLVVAPSNEQRRIVAEVEKQLTRVDASVAALKRVQANLKRYRASVLKAACEGRLVPTEAELARKEGRSYETGEQLLSRIIKERRAKWETNQLAKMVAADKLPKNDDWKSKYEEPRPLGTNGLSALPEGWIWVRAEQVCDFITKGTTPSADKLFEVAGEVPYIKVYNLTNRGALDFTVKPTFVAKITHTGELLRSRVLPGDVLMNIVGPPLGKVSIVPELFPEWNINQAIAIFRPIEGLACRYLATTLMCDDILRWAITRSKATAGQFNLTLEICRDLPLPLPPNSEQMRIMDEVEARLSAAQAADSAVEADLRRAERLRQSILKRAFEGGLVPQDPNDEPASALLERIRAANENRQLRRKRTRSSDSLVGVE